MLLNHYHDGKRKRKSVQRKKKTPQKYLKKTYVDLDSVCHFFAVFESFPQALLAQPRCRLVKREFGARNVNDTRMLLWRSFLTASTSPVHFVP
jgi:hypothetical protein